MHLQNAPQFKASKVSSTEVLYRRVSAKDLEAIGSLVKEAVRSFKKMVETLRRCRDIRCPGSAQERLVFGYTTRSDISLSGDSIGMCGGGGEVEHAGIDLAKSIWLCLEFIPFIAFSFVASVVKVGNDGAGKCI